MSKRNRRPWKFLRKSSLNRAGTRLKSLVSEPRVDEEKLQAAIDEIKAQRPPPVLWLLGKTQSGKTSIIRALTGSTDAEIGNGFQACTATARFYDFPREAPVVRFLDTRGLGERDYDPDDDIAYCESQAHLVLAVMKVTDTHQEIIADVVRSVKKRRPDWPVVLVQTSLHEAYEPGGKHLLPYPFDEISSTAIPDDLRRALQAQREHFARTAGSGSSDTAWVAVDLTQPEDGFEPVNYGIEALWAAIEQASALDLQLLLRASPDVRDAYSRAAHPHIMGYAMTAAGVGALPVLDLTLVPALQLRLLYTLGGLYRQTWSKRTTSEFLGLLGTGFAAGYGLRWAGRGLVKLIPGWGQTVGAAWSASASAAITFALGKAACYYLNSKREGIPLDPKTLRATYSAALHQKLPDRVSGNPSDDDPRADGGRQ